MISHSQWVYFGELLKLGQEPQKIKQTENPEEKQSAAAVSVLLSLFKTEK